MNPFAPTATFALALSPALLAQGPGLSTSGPSTVSCPTPGSGLCSTPAWTSQGSVPSAFYGASLQAAGDVNGDGVDDFVVGAPSDPTPFGPNTRGVVYLYYGGPAGIGATADWKIECDLLGVDSFAEAAGGAGDVNGDGYADVFVAAPRERTGLTTGFGTVRVFLGGPLGPNGGVDARTGDEDWYAEALGFGSVQFGTSAAGVGDVDGDGFDDLLVGGPQATGPAGTSSGALWLWLGSALGLNQGLDGSATNAQWFAQGTVAGGKLGDYVFAAGDLDGDGLKDFAAHAVSYGPLANRGHLFVWRGQAGGGPPNGVADAWFESGPGPNEGSGYGVAVEPADFDGDGLGDLAVGWYQRSANGGANGCAYLLRSTGTTLVGDGWSSCFTASGPGWEGYRLAAGDFDGDARADLAVASPAWFLLGTSVRGKVRVFYGGASAGAGALDLVPGWEAVGTELSPTFGTALSAGDLDGDGADDLLIGASLNDVGGVVNAGQAWLYAGRGPQPIGCASSSPDWMIVGDAPDRALGNRVSGVGDVNADGYEDFVVRESNVPGLGATVRLHRGGPNGPETVARWQVGGPPGASSLFGWGVDGAGDVNGDGFDDIVVSDSGSLAYSPSGPPTVTPGYVHVYHGGPNLPSTAPDWTAQLNAQTATRFGYDVRGIGDVNADGFDDVAVGAPGHEPTQPGDPGPAVMGRVYVWYGSATGVHQGAAGTEANADWILTSDQVGDSLGWALAAGDLDGDGISDLVVSAPHRDGLFDVQGAAYAWLGSPSGLGGGSVGSPSSANWSAQGMEDGAYFGELLASGEDLDGDGDDELVVCAQYEGSAGVARVFSGGPGGPASAPATELTGVPGSYRLGSGARLLEDFNGDGYGDLVLHANVSSPQQSEGRLLVHFGAPGGMGAVANLAMESDIHQGLLGQHSRFDGADVDGDGLTDLVAGCIGWPGVLQAPVHEGAVMLWSGTDRTRLEVTPTSVAVGGSVRATHYGGAIGARILVRTVAVDGVAVTPTVVQYGAVGPGRCWRRAFNMSGQAGVYTLEVETLDDVGQTVYSTRVDVTVQ